jgi:hypothetical protein
MGAGVVWPLLGPTLLGRARPWAGRPSQASSPFPTRLAEAESGHGPVRFRGPAQYNKKNVFLFFFYYLRKEILWKMLVYSFLLQKWWNKLCCDPHDKINGLKIFHVEFVILFCGALFNH